ncbi:MAG TPA: hypothetical protein VM756_08235 [Burkholderiales bacterium]|nr:hypothetical protein [Burkholderiales bacterium]
MQIELLLVLIVKALAELAGMFLLGRGLLWILAGRKRMDNIFYQVLSIVTDPLLRFTRRIAPRLVLDSYIPAIAFGLVLWIWLAIVFWVLPEMCSSGYDCSALMERKRAD